MQALAPGGDHIAVTSALKHLEGLGADLAITRVDVSGRTHAGLRTALENHVRCAKPEYPDAGSWGAWLERLSEEY